MAVLRSLRDRRFLLLWIGQTLSRLGDNLYRFALMWWVLEKTGSGLAMGGVMIAQAIPMIVFLLVGGALVDRFHRVRIMVSSDVARGVITALVAAGAFSGSLEIWHVYNAAVLFGIVDAFFQPAVSALVPSLVRTEDLPSANSLTVLSWEVTGIGGPALGALLVGLGGTPFVFAIDASSFVISTATLLPLLRIVVPPPSEPSKGMIGDIRQGFSVVAAEPWLWLTITMMAFINALAFTAFIVTLPFLVTETLGSDVTGLGIVQSMSSVGAALAALYLGRRSKLKRRGIVFACSAIVFGGCMVLLGLPITLWIAAVITVFHGMSLSTVGLIQMGTMQELVEPDKLGRVSSIDWLGSVCLVPVGFAITGWLTDHLTPPMIFIGVGVATMVLATLVMLHPRTRKLD